MSYNAGQYIVEDQEAQEAAGAGVTVEVSEPSEARFCVTTINNVYWLRYVGSSMNVEELVTIIAGTSVKRLTFTDTSISNLEDLLPLRLQLEVLDLVECVGVSRIDALSNFGLISLTLDRCDEIHDISPIATLHVLTRLVLRGLNEIESVRILSAVPSLVYLELSHMEQLSDISGLSKLVNLCYLTLEGCQKVKTIRSIEHLKHLYDLNLANCREVKDVNAIAMLPNLTRLNVRDAGIRDLTCLECLPALKYLDFRGTFTAFSNVKDYKDYGRFGETFSLYSAYQDCNASAPPPPYPGPSDDKGKGGKEKH